MSKQLEAEKVVCGKIIIGGNATAEAAIKTGLIPEYFEFPAARNMYKHLVSLVARNILIDGNQIIPPAGNTSENMTLIQQGTALAASSDNVEYYCNEIKRTHAEAILTTARKKASQAIDAGVELTTVMEQFKRVQALAAEITGDDTGIGTVAEHAYELMTRIELAERVEGAIFTGFKTIDDLMVALVGGDLAILAGRPSMGKTALCLDILYNNAIKNVKSFFMSMEQGGLSVAARLLAKQSKISTAKALRTPDKIPSWERDKLLSWSAALFQNAGNILIVEKARQSIRQYEEYATRAVESGAKLLAIDYLQLMRRKGSDRPDLEIGENAEQVKAIGKTLNVPTILLAQLNRGNEKDNRPPKASDLRDSGGIEQAADFIWFPHCKHEDAKQSGKRYFIQEKGRDAGVGFGELYFHRETASFHELDNAHP